MADTAAATPAAPSTATTAPAPPAPAAPRESARDRMRAKAAAALGLTPQAPATPASPPTAVATPAASAAVIEAAGVAVPEQRAGESDAQHALKLSQLANRLAHVEGDLARTKRDAEGHASERAKLEKLIEQAKKSPWKALELSGYDWQRLAEEVRDGKISPSQYAQLPPEVQEELEFARAARTKSEAAEKENAQAEQERASFAADSQHVETLLSQHAAAYPVLAGMPNAVERLTRAMREEARSTGRPPDFAAFAKAAQERITADVLPLLRNGSIVASLLTDATVRDTLARALGLSASAASPASTPQGETARQEVPAAIPPTATSETSGGDRRLTEKDRKVRMARAAKGVLGL